MGLNSHMEWNQFPTLALCFDYAHIPQREMRSGKGLSIVRCVWKAYLFSILLDCATKRQTVYVSGAMGGVESARLHCALAKGRHMREQGSL